MECLNWSRSMKSYLYGIFFLCLFSCAPSASEKYNTASNEAEILTLLNERDYGKAIWLIESQYTKDPKKSEIKFYLAQAYLGRSGFEPLAFIEKIYGPQNQYDDTLGKVFFTRCKNTSITKGEKIPLQCVFKRIFLHTPQVDEGDFAHARSLMRSAYPNPATTTTWNNTLIGIVELISLVKRTGNIYLYGKGIIENEQMRKKLLNYTWAKMQIIHAVREAQECAERGMYSGDTVSKFMLKINSVSLYETIDNKFHISSNLGNYNLLKLGKNISQSSFPTENELKEKIQRFLAEEENKIN